MGYLMLKANRKYFDHRRFFDWTYDEAIRLLICMFFDLIEYISPVLLAPILGDAIDVLGFGLGIFLFRWIGLLSLLEFFPYADVLPIFIITWIIWFLLKKQKEKDAYLRLQQEWK